MSASDSDKDSVTEVAEESFVRERPLEIARGAVLAGRYQVEEIIGKGGSGVVLRVFDRTVQTVVALKVLKTELARDAKWDKRFSRELRLGRPIQHPNVCRIFDIGEADGHRFLTMELATGGSLRDELKRRPALERPIGDRMADARAAIEGLAAIHASGVVHRDFKPDNLLRMEDGRLVISDFGLATDSATAPGVTVMIGTPHYMAPEVLAGEPATTRSDVWALGVVLHEIVFGRRPERKSVSFDGTGSRPVSPRTATERRLLQLCEDCLAESALERPPDAAAVLQQLDRYSHGPRRQNRWRYWAAGALVALVALVGVRAGIHGWRRGWRSGRSGPAVGHLVQEGLGHDLTGAAHILADGSDQVHCLSILDSHSLRVVWGNPRRADEIDLVDSKRRPSTVLPETYQFGCPQPVPGKSALLFTGRTAGGLPEIRLSASPDGRDARVITIGSEPTWVRPDEQFVYSVDSYHAAVFSLPTMSFNLLADPALGAEYGIVDKTVDPSGQRIAVLYTNITGNAVVLYDGRLFEDHRNVLVPGVRRIQFERAGERLLALAQVDDPFVSIARLDFQSNSYTKVGTVSGFDAMLASVGENGAAIAARSMTADAWVGRDDQERRLTFDGVTYSAAVATDGALLASRRGNDGRLNIWLTIPGHDPVRLTNGQYDVEPAFSPDGHTWVYADYARKGVLVCRDRSGQCHVLFSDDLMPTWPSFSSDGQLVVVMTQLKATRFTAVGADDGQPRSNWEGSAACPPVWDSGSRIWTLERVSDEYWWSERDARSGRRSGRRVRSAHSGEGPDCAGPIPNPTGGPNIKIKTVQTSRLLWFDSSALR